MTSQQTWNQRSKLDTGDKTIATGPQSQPIEPAESARALFRQSATRIANASLRCSYLHLKTSALLHHLRSARVIVSV